MKFVGLRLTLIALTAVIALPLVVSAAPIRSVKSAAPVNTYKKHGTVIYSDWQFPDTLNPLQTSIGVSAETFNLIFANLADFNSKSQLIPDLLARIPSLKNHEIANGGRTI